MREAMLEVSGVQTGNRSLLRRLNSLGVLRAVVENPQTMRELAASSGLSRTAIDAVVSDLVQLGWLVVDDSAIPGRLGRPAASFRLPADLGHFLSVDIGANHTYSVVTDLTGAMRASRTELIDEQADADARAAAALRVCDEALADASLTRDSLWAVTIGSPGAISNAGVVQHYGGTGMPGWTGLDLRARFSSEFDAAVLIEGDVALGARAELAFGAAHGREDVVYILCGRRTSGASIVNGRVHRGVHGAAGIVGELPELRWAQLNELYGTAFLTEPRPTREQIFELARVGDRAARAAVDEFADDLATGASALALAIDPELLVIGGGSAPGADVFLARFTETLNRLCPLPPEIAVSNLGSEAVAMGGISLASEHLSAVLERAVSHRDAFPTPGEALALMR